jgi:hypothetical protein
VPPGTPSLDPLTYLKTYGYDIVILRNELREDFPVNDRAPMQDAMEQGDMLPNTPSSLEARVARRALVVSSFDT